MRYYIRVDSGYILAVGTGVGGDEITESRYTDICTAIANKPEATGTTDYRLRNDLTWEPYDIEPVDDDESTPEELIEMLEDII